MISSKLRNDINAAYYELEMKQTEMAYALFPQIFEVETKWYNGYYHKDEEGNWFRDSFPIPVVIVKGICNVEIQFERIAVSTKLKRDAALAYSFDKMAGYKFEAYSVRDYLSEYYHTGQTIREMKENILRSYDKQIGFSFIFPFQMDGKQLFEFVKLLKQEGFYR